MPVGKGVMSTRLDLKVSSVNSNRTTRHPARPNIADRFIDLLAPLDERRPRGMIARLSQGYYEGWRPSRTEVASLVTDLLGKKAHDHLG